MPFFKKKKTKLNLKDSKAKKPSKKSTKSSKTSSGKKRVVVYSTKTCPWCNKTKEFLEENKVSFTTKDVGSNKKNAQEMFKKSGQKGVPVTDINGTIIVGFSEGKLKGALKL